MYNPFSLDGKRILVTGASSGIGKATAIECSKLGASVILTARNEERLLEAKSLLAGGNHPIVIADMAKESDLDNLVAQLPKLDGVVLNAGMTKTIPVQFISSNFIQEIFSVNTYAPVLLTQKLLKKKLIQKEGSIVFTASTDGILSGTLGNSIYSASKGAINGFIKVAAKELAAKKIRVNSVMPGLTKTSILNASSITEEQISEQVRSYPLGRLGEPEDIAYGIVYLLSDASSWVCGSSLLIDGGLTLK